jgi:hypothetical protein
MLGIRVKFVAYELAEGLQSCIYQIPENATVRELLAICEEQNKVTIPPENLKLMLFILDGKPALMDTPITKDGTLYVTRVIIGG